MVELSSKDRLQPSLLDRLLDHDPRSAVESLEARALTRNQLRAAVLRAKVAAIEQAVTQAIKVFEPRVDPKTLQVQLKQEVRNQHNTVEMVIRAQMWGQPVPLELLLSASMDPDTGTTQLRELRA